MNIFCYILLTAICMLYFSVRTNGRCPCFRQEINVPAMLLRTPSKTCSMDLKSRRIADRQICPSWSKISLDPKRTPKYLAEKKCCHQECSAGEGYRCEEYRVPIGVTYHDVDAEGREVIRPEILNVSLTCVCTAPRILPEPPTK